MSVAASNEDDQAIAADAGFGGSEVRVYRFARPHDVRGSFLPPGISMGLHPHLNAAQAADAAAHVDRFRVAVQQLSQVHSDGLLRHELEHCAQWAVGGRALFDLTSAVDNALVLRFGSIRGLWALRYVGPVEGDANAAAARFVRAHNGDHACDALVGGEDGLLFASQPAPGERSSLRQRQACFAAVLGDAVEHVGARTLIVALGTEAHAAWEAARKDAAVHHHSELAVAAAPSAEAMEKAGIDDVRRAWTQALTETRQAYEHALAVAGFAPRPSA